ncbi:hypothetical protein BY458DRAFT_490188 [Sporodiniella umbellata]|nr:hypothetical protein BY458DRAFT_490188 [Sporodiniella umbellata]
MCYYFNSTATACLKKRHKDLASDRKKVTINNKQPFLAGRLHLSSIKWFSSRLIERELCFLFPEIESVQHFRGILVFTTNSTADGWDSNCTLEQQVRYNRVF